MKSSYASFSDFKTDLRTWMQQNPNALQLDGRTSPKSNPKQVIKVQMPEISESDTPAVYFHGDTTRAALDEILRSEITDFILVPPAAGRKQWRFHFARSHGYSSETIADGLYTDLEKT